MYIILNHTLVQAENAAVPVSDRGFRYGDGAFETIAVQERVPYRFEFHMRRLTAGLEAIRIAFDTECLWEESRRLLHANGITDGLLRIQVTRGSGGRGYMPDITAKPTVVIETHTLPDLPSAPVTLYGSSYAKIPAISLPTEKLCNALGSTLARLEASDHGCFDALMLGAGGHIAETSSGNIFWVQDGTLYTPSLACGAINGSIRAAVMELSPLPVQEVQAPITTLAQANAVFVTNVSWKVLAVAALKPTGMRWESAAIADTYRRLILDDMQRYSQSERPRWQTAPAA